MVKLVSTTPAFTSILTWPIKFGLKSTSQRLRGFRLHCMPTWILGGSLLLTARISRESYSLSSVRLSSSTSCAAPVQYRCHNRTNSAGGGAFGSQLQRKNSPWPARISRGRVPSFLILAWWYTASTCCQPWCHSVAVIWGLLLPTSPRTPLVVWAFFGDVR